MKQVINNAYSYVTNGLLCIIIDTTITMWLGD